MIHAISGIRNELLNVMPAPPTKLLNPPNPIPREELFPFIQTLQPLGWTFHLIYYTAGQGNKGKKKKHENIHFSAAP